MNSFNEYFGSYYEESEGNYILSNNMSYSFNWAHWVLILMGPTALLFWLGLGCRKKIKATNSNNALNDVNVNANACILERIILPLEDSLN